MSRPHWFVVPGANGPITGGTLYDRELLSALRAANFPVRALGPAELAGEAAAEPPAVIWVDTLFLAELPALTRRLPAGSRLGLVAHYLPALVEHGAAISRSELTPDETFAIDRADVALVPSAFMRRTLERLSARRRPVLVVEPGRQARGTMPGPRSRDGVSAISVGSLVRGKGLEPFLRALGDGVDRSQRFRLTIIGNRSMDREYAARSEAVVAGHALLRERVRFLGELDPNATLERMAENDVFVSASTMEAYGMALAEARTLGLPIVARAGGNVEAHVKAEAGGELVETHAELAAAFLRICSAPLELRARGERARAQALGGRSWSEAAAEFMTQSARLETPADH
jgi:glycosyltransferase involved in cell wall biosynthesis